MFFSVFHGRYLEYNLSGQRYIFFFLIQNFKIYFLQNYKKTTIAANEQNHTGVKNWCQKTILNIFVKNN